MTDAQEALAKLIQVWNSSSQEDHRSLIPVPSYQGVFLSYKCDEWREHHPEAFPQFCKDQKEDSVSVYDLYECGSFSLPPSIVKMFVEKEVDFATLEAFITLLIQEKDKQRNVTLSIPPPR